MPQDSTVAQPLAWAA